MVVRPDTVIPQGLLTSININYLHYINGPQAGGDLEKTEGEKSFVESFHRVMLLFSHYFRNPRKQQI